MISLFKVPSSAALILYLCFWLPFVNLYHPLSIALISLGLVFNILHFLGKFSFSRLRYIYLIGAGYLPLYLYGTWRGIETGTMWLALLGIAKMTELKGKRDYYLFLLILELLLGAELLASDSLYLIGYLVVLAPLSFIFLHNTQQSKKKAYLKERKKVIFQIFLTSFPIAALLFVLFPRFQMGNFFFTNRGITSASGFTTEISPGEISQLAQSDKVVFRVLFDKQRPSSQHLYWKGATLNQGDGLNWQKGVTKPVRRKPKRESPFSYTLEHNDLKVGPLFTLEGTRHISPLSKFTYLAYQDGVFTATPLSNQKIRYRGSIGEVQYQTKPSELAKYIGTENRIGPRLKVFVNRLRKKGKNDNDNMVRELMNYYMSQKFIYSLKPGTYTSDDPLAEFLFDRKIGFCEHYAGATVSVLRALGIPARIVTGYQGGKYNDLGSYFIIREKDAHAWVEYWSIKQKKWQRIDPVEFVMPERILYGMDGFQFFDENPFARDNEEYNSEQHSGTFSKLLLTYDYLYFQLNSKFLSYNIKTQLKLINNFGFNFTSPWTLALLSGGFVFLIVLVLMIRNLISVTQVDPADKVMRKLFRQLEKRGYRKAPSETLPQFLSRTSLEVQTKEDISNLYNRAKYSTNKRESLNLLKTAIENGIGNI